MAEYEGSRIIPAAPGIMLGAISPAAGDLLDRIMADWQAHCTGLPAGYPRDPAYALAYWLVRWSGLVQPTPDPPPLALRPDVAPERRAAPVFPLLVLCCPHCRRAGVESGQRCAHCGQQIAAFQAEII